jgi:hypothetical protein
LIEIVTSGSVFIDLGCIKGRGDDDGMFWYDHGIFFHRTGKDKANGKE